jgi:FkbM family methyltransferase
VKNGIKYVLQKSLGFQNYLYVFALFKIRTLKSDKKEKDFFHFINLLSDKNGAVLDIGANIGIMAVHLAQKVPNATVHAFEPIPDNASVLRKVLKRFKLKNVQVHEFALGENEGTVEMILPFNGKTKMQGLSHVKHETIDEWNEGQEFEVPIKKLDTLFPEDRIQGIKIDVENFEYFVLKGGMTILEMHKPIIYAELWDNQNRELCFDLLQELSYETYVIEGNEMVMYDPVHHKKQNFIFKPN